jgi:hypothetical protein
MESNYYLIPNEVNFSATNELLNFNPVHFNTQTFPSIMKL